MLSNKYLSIINKFIILSISIIIIFATISRVGLIADGPWQLISTLSSKKIWFVTSDREISYIAQHFLSYIFMFFGVESVKFYTYLFTFSQFIIFILSVLISNCVLKKEEQKIIINSYSLFISMVGSLLPLELFSSLSVSITLYAIWLRNSNEINFKIYEILTILALFFTHPATIIYIGFTLLRRLTKFMKNKNKIDFWYFIIILVIFIATFSRVIKSKYWEKPINTEIAYNLLSYDSLKSINKLTLFLLIFILIQIMFEKRHSLKLELTFLILFIISLIININNNVVSMDILNGRVWIMILTASFIFISSLIEGRNSLRRSIGIIDVKVLLQLSISIVFIFSTITNLYKHFLWVSYLDSSLNQNIGYIDLTEKIDKNQFNFSWNYGPISLLLNDENSSWILPSSSYKGWEPIPHSLNLPFYIGECRRVEFEFPNC